MDSKANHANFMALSSVGKYYFKTSYHNLIINSICSSLRILLMAMTIKGKRQSNAKIWHEVESPSAIHQVPELTENIRTFLYRKKRKRIGGMKKRRK